ncbi:hypothetical protein Sru01_01930 [Sphaerisporangium rufum]|uniref:Bacterial Ig-like domain-containing protein n=1 Tax=Sphaerisporangium rufum TaxID=1381558 RepID=A0A919QYP6_9ACTN|nr:ice-binding family protein [Sphaerisporangium rufum]GII75211.1 hypothetical protein Sru01_01930 [Sphaerisporangium rufum]
MEYRGSRTRTVRRITRPLLATATGAALLAPGPAGAAALAGSGRGEPPPPAPADPGRPPSTGRPPVRPLEPAPLGNPPHLLPPAEDRPPVVAPLADRPPVMAPPADRPPVMAPPADRPPVVAPPADRPSGGRARPAGALGAAGRFAVLAGIPPTAGGRNRVLGDLAISPGRTAGGLDPGEVTGARHLGDAAARQARRDFAAAYADLSRRRATGTITPSRSRPALRPGVYVSTTGGFTLTGNVTLDAHGDPDALFVFRGRSFTTEPGSSITLSGAAQPCNVMVVTEDVARLGARSDFRGTLLARGGARLGTGARVEGRVLAGRDATVSLQGNTITTPPCAVPLAGQATVTILAVLDPASGKDAGPLRLVATVRAADGPPAGQVIFTRDGIGVGAARLDARGHARFSLPVSPGRHEITARYAGSAGHHSSVSAPVVTRLR